LRALRIEKMVAEWRSGLSWAQVASACGLTDQAHLIREFKDVVGEAPTKVFAHEVRADIGKMKEPHKETHFVVQRMLGNERL
jgi:AraC-like DNA-binding protein